MPSFCSDPWKKTPHNEIISMPCEKGIKETRTAGELQQSDKMSLHKAWRQKAAQTYISLL